MIWQFKIAENLRNLDWCTPKPSNFVLWKFTFNPKTSLKHLRIFLITKMFSVCALQMNKMSSADYNILILMIFFLPIWTPCKSLYPLLASTSPKPSATIRKRKRCEMITLPFFNLNPSICLSFTKHIQMRIQDIP